MDLLKGYEILLGTYEAFLLGYKLHQTEVSSLEGLSKTEAETLQEIKTSFANHAHSASVRSITAGDKFLVSAGGDENVKIFNLRNRSEHGALTHADGVINCMLFYDKRHLITASEDGKISILKTTTGWSVEKTLLKHQAGVTDLALHPSGKLMLSVGKDGKLITWNLIKGRSAYITNLHENADFVRWSPSGNYYVVGCYKHVDIYSVNTAAVEVSLPFPGRLNEVIFLDDVTIAVAGEMSHIEVYSIVSKTLLMKFEAHTNRVRCMTLISKELSPNDEKSNHLSHQCLVTASNDGLVKIWKVSRKPLSASLNTNEDTTVKPKFAFDVSEEARVDTKCRITCLKVHKVPAVESGVTKTERKKKRAPESSSNESINVHKKGVQIADALLTSSEISNNPVTQKKKAKVTVQDEMIIAAENANVKSGDEVKDKPGKPTSAKKKKAKNI